MHAGVRIPLDLFVWKGQWLDHQEASTESQEGDGGWLHNKFKKTWKKVRFTAVVLTRSDIKNYVCSIREFSYLLGQFRSVFMAFMSTYCRKKENIFSITIFIVQL